MLDGVLAVAHALALLRCGILSMALFVGACGGGAPPDGAPPGPGEGGGQPPRPSRTGSDVAVREPLLGPPEPPSPRAGPGGVDVRVVDADGAPIEGATVIDVHGTQATNDEGEASVGPFRGGHGMPSQCRRERTITVLVDGFEPVTHVCEPWGGRAEVVRILDRGSVLAGRCIDSRGFPVPGVAVRVEYEQGPDQRMVSDADGRFRLTEAARKEGRLRIRERGWTCRPLAVVPPQEGIELVLYRPAWIHGRFDGRYERARGFRARLLVETNQGWAGRLPHDKPFSIPCCPGEVVLRWEDAVLGRFSVEEGGVLEDVVIPVDLTSRRTDAGGADRPWAELDLFELGDTKTVIAACYEDLGVRRLGTFDGKQLERVRLRSHALRWLSVEADGGAWKVPASAGERVRIERPPRARLSFQLLDRSGHPVREGWGEIRWTGSRYPAGHAYCGGEAAPRPPGSPQAAPDAMPGTFVSGPMGAGVFDIAWRLGHDREARLLRRGVVMPDPPTPLHLGGIQIPEPAEIRVRVRMNGGALVPGAVVRLVGDGRHVAARADRDGVAVLELSDPTGLVLEAEGPAGRSGRVPVADGGVEGIITIHLDRGPR